MKTYQNAFFTLGGGKIKNRNHECTNVIVCRAESSPADGVWFETSEDIIAIYQLDPLWIENGRQYFGKM